MPRWPRWTPWPSPWPRWPRYRHGALRGAGWGPARAATASAPTAAHRSHTSLRGSTAHRTHPRVGPGPLGWGVGWGGVGKIKSHPLLIGGARSQPEWGLLPDKQFGAAAPGVDSAFREAQPPPAAVGGGAWRGGTRVGTLRQGAQRLRGVVVAVAVCVHSPAPTSPSLSPSRQPATPPFTAEGKPLAPPQIDIRGGRGGRRAPPSPHPPDPGSSPVPTLAIYCRIPLSRVGVQGGIGAVNKQPLRSDTSARPGQALPSPAPPRARNKQNGTANSGPLRPAADGSISDSAPPESRVRPGSPGSARTLIPEQRRGRPGAQVHSGQKKSGGQ